MLVEVVLMRREGRKLDADELAAATRHRGHLAVAAGEATLGAYDGPGPTVLPPLLRARLHRLKGDSLVLHGEEFVPGSGVPGEYRPQAWLVRLVA